MDGIRFTWPLASLTATRESFRIAVFGARYELRPQEIRLRRAWRHLWPGLQIEHARTDLPRDLFFMPLFRPALVRDLSRLGYTIG